MKYSEEVKQILLNAGWYPGRLVSWEPHPKYGRFSVADSILNEFEHLTVGRVGRGIECGTCCITFSTLLVDFYNSDASFCKSRQIELYPLGVICDGDGSLFTDSLGNIYVRDEIGRLGLFPLNQTFENALHALLLGFNLQGTPRANQ